MKQGYIRLYRKILDNPVVMKDCEHLSVFIYLLLKATHKEVKQFFGNELIMLKPGQLITGSRAIATELKTNFSKIHRVLKAFEKCNIIETQVNSKGSLITISNWQTYQMSETQMKHDCNTTETQLKRNNNDNNINNIKKEKINKKEKKFEKPTLEEVQNYIIEKNLNVSASGFIDYYESNGWKVGRNPMKDWKATIRGWSRRDIPTQITRKPFKHENKPDWYGQEIEEDLASEEEIKALEERLKHED